MKILDMVWPAIYVSAGLEKLWYSIFLTILVNGWFFNGCFIFQRENPS